MEMCLASILRAENHELTHTCRTYRSQGHQQVGVGEEDQAEGHHEAGDEQGQDVAVVVAATRVPVGPTRGSQTWNK